MTSQEFSKLRGQLIVDYGARLVPEDLYSTHAGFKSTVDKLAKYAKVQPQKIVGSVLLAWHGMQNGVSA